MVSLRCKLFVKTELDNLDIPYDYVDLGEVKLKKNISKPLKESLSKVLHEVGLEIMEDKDAVLVEKIKSIIIEMVHYSDEIPNINFSDFLHEKLQQDYHILSELFSKTKGITIEHYIILNKIERVKELIMYDELNLTEISYKMNYSSVAHLSNQFKKITGLTPSFFKNLKRKNRTNLDSL
jgi:YesN/AraC family two-component response regulator